tara:strand:- start:37 stop:366 length:330 start_codon:yes stop_codon:yes gene_type:complete
MLGKLLKLIFILIIVAIMILIVPYLKYRTIAKRRKQINDKPCDCSSEDCNGDEECKEWRDEMRSTLAYCTAKMVKGTWNPDTMNITIDNWQCYAIAYMNQLKIPILFDP